MNERDDELVIVHADQNRFAPAYCRKCGTAFRLAQGRIDGPSVWQQGCECRECWEKPALPDPWQPIETIPVSGDPVLVAVQCYPGGKFVSGAIRAGFGWPEGTILLADRCFEQLRPGERAYAWRHMPEAP